MAALLPTPQTEPCLSRPGTRVDLWIATPLETCLIDAD
jgi:hypothetical protein